MANVKATDLIDFTRASKGHALAKVSYGSELVENGTFDTDTTGSTPATWETNNANASLIKQADGTALFSSTSFAYARVEFASKPVLSVGLYKVSFEISEWSGSLASVHVGIGVGGNTISGNGTYSYIFTSTAEQAYELQIRPNGGGTGSFKIDNVSVKEVTFDQPDGTLQLFEHPEGIPRIEYDADGNLLGLLIEESRTNLLPYSEDFSNAAWSKGPSATVEDTTIVSPDGLQNAKQVEMSSTTAGVYETVPVIASTVYTFSVWIKADTAGSIRLARTNSGPDGADVDVTTEWQRFSVQITPTTSIDGPQIRRDNAGQLSKIYIYGAQLEAGSFPTSYIKTTGSTATRSADVASIPVSDFGYNQSEGTLFAVAQNIAGNTADPRVVTLSDGTADNRIRIDVNDGANIRMTVTDGGVAQTSAQNTFTDYDSQYKVALAFKENNFKLLVNNSVSLTDSTGTVPDDITTVYVGSNFNGAGGRINGHIKSIKYIPKRLSNAKLQELTS